MQTTPMPSPSRRLMRGYGPAVALALTFFLMAVFVPTVGQEIVTTTDGSVPAGGLLPEAGEPGPRPEDAPGQPEALPGPHSPGPAAKTTEPPASGRAKGRSGGCPDRAAQVSGDPYSPPCVAFSGDNGGATARGVTGKDIVVSARILDEKGFQQTLAVLAGAEITDQPADVRRTIGTLAEYFNRRFQMYGRKLKVEFYDGKGSSTKELLGGGQAEAEADAVTVAEQIGAFAEINAGTPPFSDALARRKVIAFGAPYLSREWLVGRRPYNWSVATDCSIISESGSQFSIRQLGGGRTADLAGPGLQGKPRKFAILAPENPWYRECVRSAKKITAAAGEPEPVDIAYKLDLNTMSNQAASVIAKLKSEGVTTVTCGCDPIFPVFLTSKAAEQGYNPEWVVVGTALTDVDVVGQLYEPEQWSRAIGISYLGKPLPTRAGLGYAAYKSVRSDEPAFAVETIYAQMYELALGVQGAGPDLSPQSFEQGLFRYPGGTGPFGTWAFDADSYTPTQDYRVIYWKPDQVSPQNGKKGTYVEAYGGKRFAYAKNELPKDSPSSWRK